MYSLLKAVTRLAGMTMMEVLELLGCTGLVDVDPPHTPAQLGSGEYPLLL